MSWPLVQGPEVRGKSNDTDTEGVVSAAFHSLRTVDSHSAVFVDGLFDVYYL